MKQMAFQKGGVPESLEVFKEGFPIFHVKHSSAFLPKRLVSAAEKKCLIERHKPSTVKMGSALAYGTELRK